MRALVVAQNITVDGSIEMLGDWFDPEGQGDQSDLLEELHRQDSQSNAFLTGRQTFEDLRSYWPKQLDDASGITKYLNEVRKYVVSSTITDPQWENTTILSGDPVQQVQELKEQQGRDIVVTGSITLCDTLINAGLVDEYRLFVYPVVQGRGPGINPTADAECGQGTGRLADVPFHGMEPVTTIGDMSDAQTLAGRQQVLHSLREQRAQWDLKWIGRDVKVSASCGGVAPPPCLR